MSSSKTILVVDDNAINRTILAKILSEKYAVLEAENGQAALALLNAHTDEIIAVMLDLLMPVMDGYAVLEAVRDDARYSNLPLIVTTENSDNSNEIRALKLGAWDFVSKPYNPEIIGFRLKNAIDRSQLSALKQLQYLSEYDALTGIYNKAKFFHATRELLDAYPEETFVFLRFDVDRFQLINSFFGAAEGDKLLIYLAKQLAAAAEPYAEVTYGRIESDIFGCCLPYDPTTIVGMIEYAKETLTRYNPNYDIVPSMGVYVLEDRTISVEEMYNRATLAAKTCKGNYVDYYAFYNEGMSAALSAEQEITNDMNYALNNGQFEVYLQPQYNIHTNLPCGAEALVRWIHPQKGMLSPGEFIPIFERNGFISKLDYYVWEQACSCLHRWKLQGMKPYPLSVNVSRVNIYNPKLVETLLALVERYEVEPALLDLELTESAYTDNPIAMKKVMSQLQGHGFTIMMDDFGSGYSSLSVLKDIAIDVLKIDMRFLSATEVPGRGENIIASVVRMAKWLNIPVIAEGAETVEQVDFLRSVGCDYVQGYYFARPMPISEYELLCHSRAFDQMPITAQSHEHYRYDDLFSFSTEMKPFLENVLQAAAIYEFADDHIEIIRVNEAYYALLGHEDMLANSLGPLSLVDAAYQASLLNAFRLCVNTRAPADCDYRRSRAGGSPIWIYTELRYVTTVGNKHILIGELTDITLRREIDSELQKYRASLLSSRYETNTALIVDDGAINRTVLKKILQNQFAFLEAGDGKEAIRMLQENREQIDLILLDIVMPRMDGKEFLQYKQKRPELDGIPVIMITSDDSPAQQISTLALGANDYIVKPFIPEVVLRRVKNVMESSHRFREMVKEYNSMSEQVKTDQMTGLLNRASAQRMITKQLESTPDAAAMLMLDIDNFKKFNDTRGHAYGDKIIAAVAEKLRCTFRQSDIVARMGGDEFSIFMGSLPNKAAVELKARQLCRSISEITLEGEPIEITCSVGIAIPTDQDTSFDLLYQNADKALYNAKCRGKNTFSIYGEESPPSSISNWIDDVESVVDAINDSIYVCDRDSYEMIYVNDNLCQRMGLTREACKGRKCYELLMQRTTPCPFCPCATMVEGQVYTRLFQIPNTKQLFLMRGKNIKRGDAVIHLEVAVDIMEVENMELYGEVIGHGEG